MRPRRPGEAMVSQITKTGSAQRLAFVDVIRASAAIMVLVAHFVELYLYQPAIVGASIGAPPPVTTGPDWLREYFLRPFNFGGLAVALFFLAGGFLAPMALARRPAGPYLADRLFRIYPAWIAAFALSCGALMVSWKVWGATAPYSLGDYVANLLLAPDLLFRQTIVGPLWTLEVQLKFFLLVALFAGPVRRGAIWPALVWGVATLALYAATSLPCRGQDDNCFLGYGQLYLFAGWEAMYVTYCFIGVVFYAHWSGRLATGPAIACALALFALYAISFPFSGLFGRRMPSAIGTYFLALAIFAACYVLQGRIRSAPWIDFIARISYPLYALHMLVGFVTLRLLEYLGAPYLLSLSLTLAFVLALASALTTFVEQPGVRIGKRLVASISPGGA